MPIDISSLINPFSPLRDRDPTKSYRAFRELGQRDKQLGDARLAQTENLSQQQLEEQGRDTRLGAKHEQEMRLLSTERGYAMDDAARKGIRQLEQVFNSGDYAAAIAMLPSLKRLGVNVDVRTGEGGRPQLILGGGGQARAPQDTSAEVAPPEYELPAPSIQEVVGDEAPPEEAQGAPPTRESGSGGGSPVSLDAETLERLKNERWRGVTSGLSRAMPGRYRPQQLGLFDAAAATNAPLKNRLAMVTKQGAEPFRMTRHMEGQEGANYRAGVMSGYRDDSRELQHRKYASGQVDEMLRRQGVPKAIENYSQIRNTAQMFESGREEGQAMAIKTLIGMVESGRITDKDYELGKHGLSSFFRQVYNQGREMIKGGLSPDQLDNFKNLTAIVAKRDAEKLRNAAKNVYGYVSNLPYTEEREEAAAVIKGIVPREFQPIGLAFESREKPQRTLPTARSGRTSVTVSGSNSGLDLKTEIDPENEADSILE
jgi:hypothetical protein